MKNIAIILASGSGSRFGGPIPKQFLKVKGKMIIEYSLDVFEKNKKIDEICIVYKKGCLHYIEPLQKKYKKLKKLVVGGKERFDSSYNGIMSYENENIYNTNILIHDAVRPLINSELLNNLIKYLGKYEAVIPVCSSIDTLLKRNKKNKLKVLNRNEIFRVQTPQALRLNILIKSYKKFVNQRLEIFTDDFSVVLSFYPKLSLKTLIIERSNIKITNKTDLIIFKSLSK